MYRSRLTLASTDAAAIAALRQSPSITARCSKPKAGTLNPSTRQTVPSRATPSRADRSASRFVLWRPRLSIPPTQRDTITDRAAAPEPRAERRSWPGQTRAPASTARYRRSAESPQLRPIIGRCSAEDHGGGQVEGRAVRSERTSEQGRSTVRLWCSYGTPIQDGRWEGAPAAPPFLESSDLPRRPVRRERLADHPVLRHRPPLAAVRARAAVVAHHEEVAVGDRDLLRQVADRAAVVQPRVGLALPPAVDVDAPAAHGQPVAANAHHPLDEVGVRLPVRRPGARRALRVLDAAGVVLGAGGRLEDEDGAAVVVAEVLREAVGEHPLPPLERPGH